jgi:hypothetical protein
MPEESAAPSPAPTTLAPELAEEAQLGGTPAGRAANAALRAISRTARSVLYDPSNDAIRAHIEDLRARMAEALQVAGTLALEVRPFELVLGGEVVYLERDRERSLAFRMYRDGVRRLTIHPEIEWDEILRLLEVLSVRYTSIRQNEDDIVTLLWKAGFQHAELDAVEGFVPEEEDEVPGAHHGSRRSEMRAEVPADWDLPARARGEPTTVLPRAVPEAELERLRAEEAPNALPANAVRAVVAMLEAVADTTDPTSFADLAGFVGEVRDFLLADGQLAQLTTLVRALKDESMLDPAQVAPILATFADKRAIGKILHSVPKGAETAPPELVALLDLLPADHLAHLIDLLAEERSESSRRCARSLIEHYAPKRPEELIGRLRGAEPAVARDLLRVCAHALPERAVESALELALHPDDGVVLEALWILGAAPPAPAVGRMLVRMLESSSAEIRLRVVEALAKRKEHAAFAPLARHVARRARHSLTTREAETYGQGLARLSPDAALALYREWSRERRRLERVVPRPHERLLRWAAVSGLGILPGEEPEQLIRSVMEHCDDELRRHCTALLARREQGGAAWMT